MMMINCHANKQISFKFSSFSIIYIKSFVGNMSSNPPGYTPVYNPANGQPASYQQPTNYVYGQPQVSHPPMGQPVGGYVPMSEFEPGYHEYMKRMQQMNSQAASNPYNSTYQSTTGGPNNNSAHTRQHYPSPQRRYMSGFSYNDSRYSHGEVQTVRTNDPIKTYCANCEDEVHTNVISYPGPYAWGACMVCCLMGCWLFCCVPLCIDPLNKSRHYCDRCNKLLAVNN